MKQITNIDKAIAQIVLDFPFFASILLRRPLVQTTAVPTLAVDAKGTIYYNKNFTDGLTVPQLIWGLCHEVGHVIGQHAARLHGRKHKKWNYATDAWINDMLGECKIGESIPNTVNMPGSYNDTPDAIYNRLPDQPAGNGNPNNGQGDNCPNNGQGGYMDNDGLGEDLKDDGGPAMTEAELKEQEAQIKIEVAEAAQAAKMRGKLPGALTKFIADFLESKVPWYEVLEKYMTERCKTEASWTRPNRRYIGQGTYLPSMLSDHMMGTIGLIVDVSGSVSKQELAHYNGHIARIVEQCKPIRTAVAYVDTQVQKSAEFEQGEPVRLEFYSGGGTDMRVGIDWMQEHYADLSVVVVLTDGYTPFPDSTDVPVVWCISTNTTAPAEAGETIHFELE